MKTHWEQREQPIYSLTVGKGGHKLKSVAPPPPLVPGQVPPPLPPPPSSPAGGLPANFTAVPGMRYLGPGGLIVTAISMASFANSLTGMLRRPVVDNTGLQGFFDIRLEFDAESTLRGGPPLGTDPVGPPIFTAIPDQLGLRLESTKGPVAFLVIDSVQKPTEN